MSQRVMIAMAIACNPKLLIADEPTTALDVTIQAQIIDLLLELQRKENMALILITHDLALVAEAARRIIVMYAGQVVEEGRAEEILNVHAIHILKRYYVRYRNLQKENRVYNLYRGLCRGNMIAQQAVY
ncbi:dipeptide transport ATP-binding protein DppD [Pasteurella multocida]|nr:dipeptide transport ATP-binding protein DppD [Pasteurella multocida]